jgi:serine protease
MSNERLFDRIRQNVRQSVGAESAAAAGASEPDLADLARSQLARFSETDGFEAQSAEVRSYIGHADEGLKQLKIDPSTILNARQRIGFEALVRLTGRPPLPIVCDQLDESDPLAPEWGGNIPFAQTLVKAAAPSVGRIDLNGRHVGTGFIIAPNLVLTNRHVLEAIATPFESHAGEVRWVLHAGKRWIDFKREKDKDDTRRHLIVELVAAGKDTIGRTVNFDHLDAAILRIEEKSLEGEPCAPRPLALAGSKLVYETGAEIGVIGYPARPDLEPSAYVDTSEGAEVVRTLVRLFQSWWGCKRYCPGYLIEPPALTKAAPWVVAHDATTTGGASGSAVITGVGQAGIVMGLHFGGLTREANYAHGMRAIGPVLSEFAHQNFVYRPPLA